MEDRGVEVVDRNDVLHGLIAEFVGGAVAEGGFDSGAHQHAGEAEGVVVAAGGAFLEHRHAAEFRAEKDEGVVEQPAAFQVAQQRRGRLIENRAVNVVLLL